MFTFVINNTKVMNINDKKNSLTLIKILEPKIRTNGAKRKIGLFKCDCGNESIKAIDSIKAGHIKHCASCGIKAAAISRSTHNLVKHPLYAKWNYMKNRCYNKNVERYKNYGGRGIKVCNEWKKDFFAFYTWSIENGYKEGLSIERKDINGNYEPDNCEYIPMLEQSYNKINTFYVEYEGVKISLAKLLMQNNMGANTYSVIWHGMKKGKSFDYYKEKLNIKLT